MKSAKNKSGQTDLPAANGRTAAAAELGPNDLFGEIESTGDEAALALLERVAQDRRQENRARDMVGAAV